MELGKDSVLETKETKERMSHVAKPPSPPSYTPTSPSWARAGYGGQIQILYNHSNT